MNMYLAHSKYCMLHLHFPIRGLLLIMADYHLIILLFLIPGRSAKQRELESCSLELLHVLVRKLAFLSLLKQVVLLPLRLDPLPQS